MRGIKTEPPLAMVSMDNCSHNGEKLKQAIVTMAEGWTRRGQAEAGFLDYVQNERQVSFPWTMIDKITPRPDPAIEAPLNRMGLRGDQSDCNGGSTPTSRRLSTRKNANTSSSRTASPMAGRR